MEAKVCMAEPKRHIIQAHKKTANKKKFGACTVQPPSWKIAN